MGYWEGGKYGLLGLSLHGVHCVWHGKTTCLVLAWDTEMLIGIKIPMA